MGGWYSAGNVRPRYSLTRSYVGRIVIPFLLLLVNGNHQDVIIPLSLLVMMVMKCLPNILRNQCCWLWSQAEEGGEESAGVHFMNETKAWAGFMVLLLRKGGNDDNVDEEVEE